MKMKVLFIVALSLCLMAPAAMADPITVNGSVGAAWQSFSSGNIDEDSAPYWDNVSMDGANKNVGYFLTGTGATFGGGTNYLGTAPQFWGMSFNSVTDTGGAADTSFTASTTFPSSTNTFLLRITAYSGTDEVGIYDTVTGAKTKFFGPTDSVGDTNIVSLYKSFGFYGKSGDGNTYYSDSSLNPSGETSHQHFALFQDADHIGCYFLGFEDLAGITGTEKIGDFNDMVVEFCPVPLPGALLLLGGGLIRLVSYGRRRRELAV